MKNKYFIGIRAKFFTIFFISLVIGIFVALFLNGAARNKSTDYTREISNFNSQCLALFEKIDINKNNEEELQNFIDENAGYVDIFIVNRQGNIILKSKNNYEKQIDINNLINKKAQTDFKEKQIKYYWTKLLDNDRYVVITKYLVMGDQWKFLIFGIIIFILLFLLLTYGRIKYIDYLSQGLKEISKGNLDYRVDIKGKDELSILGESINYMTQELKNMKEKEKQAEKNKDILIVNVSHDLRTPLTSIVGYVKLLKEKYREENEMGKYIDIIDDKAHRLEGLINDLFEYTKLLSCDIKIEKTEVSLNEFMRQIAEGMMPICSENNLDILLEEPEDELFVEIDPVKMVRVFENIIINAIRYSSESSNIKIRVSRAEHGAIVSIENEGKPIKKEDLIKVFDRFYRTDEARNSQTGGSGLGLSIAKSIVDLHGGNIWCESEGNLVCFYVLI